MDYTDISTVKSEMHIVSGSSVDDVLLGKLITSASRAWDRKCTGVPDALDYFASGSIVGEVLVGQVDHTGSKIICYPHKPIVNSVQSFSYQRNITQSLYTVDVSRVEPYGPKVTAYPNNLSFDFPSQCMVVLNYTGGLGATLADLPADMVEAVTILVARFYREAETGLGDAIGVAELGSMVYTKAWPIRVKETAEYYRRKVGWRHVA